MYIGKEDKAYIIVFFLIFSVSVFGQSGISHKYHFDDKGQKTDVKSDDQSLTINYSLSEINIDNLTNSNGSFYRVSIPGHSPSSGSGTPELPVYSRLIVLPEGCSYSIRISDVKSISIKPSEENFKGLLYPAQESQTKQQEPSRTDFKIDKKLYKTRGFIKGDTVTIEKIGKVRGRQLATLSISPVRYNPVSNILKVVTSMKITINYTGSISSMTKSASSESLLFAETLDKGILNYYPSDLITGYSDKPVEMIVLTDTSYRKFLQPLFTWKKQKGFRIHVLYAGEGLAGKTYSEIKESITKIYNTSKSEGHPPEYLLIIGDVAKIPYYGAGNLTDMYYGEFDGNGDYIPDMFIGRIPARDTSSVKSVVKKLIQYEKFQFADTNTFYRRALATEGKDVTYGDYMNGQIKYAVTNYLTTGNKINEFHFYYPDGYTKKDSILKLISGGLSFINYTGHGSSSAWLHLDIKSSDVKTLNNSNMYPFIISNACRTAQFSDTTSLGSKMLTAADKGAIGYIGCTNDSYWDEDFYWAVGVGTPGNNPQYSNTGLGAYDRLFHTHGESASDWYTTMGQVNYAGNMSVSASTSNKKGYYWETYELLGDPSVIPIIGTPSAFTTSVPDTLPNDIKTLSFTTDPFAYVAVSHFDTLWDARFAGPSGSVMLSMPGLSNDSCLVVITGQNRKPLIKTVYISTVAKEYINLTDSGLNDSKGNNNGKADFGETISLNLKINNLGLTGASNLTASITSTSPWVTINKNSTVIGNLPATSETVLDDALELTIDNDVPDLGIITVDLDLKDSKTEKKYKIDITIHAPKLEIVNCYIDDTGYGNGNYIADPGETFNLVFQVRNLGSSNTSGQFSVESQENDFTVLNQNIKSGTLQFGGITEIPVTVKLAENAGFGEYIPLSSTLDCNPYIVNKDFAFRVGKVRESFESSTFKVFPWINLSQIPWTISRDFSADGILSAQSGAIGHNGSTSLIIRAFYPENDSLKFLCRVSSEENYDYLAFNLNDTEVARRSGEVPWEKISVAVPAGLNKMEWVYKKDNSVSKGADAAWIDLIDFSSSVPMKFISRDLEVARIVTPVQKDVYGMEPVTVKILNPGIDTINGFNLGYTVNNRAPVMQHFDDKLVPYHDSLTVTFERRADMDLNGIYDLSVYGSNNDDDYQHNDTIRVNLVNSEIEETIYVYPNPFNDRLYINLNSKTEGKVRVSIANSAGMKVVDLDEYLVEGENQITIDTGFLSPSLYILTLNGMNYTKAVPLIKMRK